jgi:DNA-binding response OmpR family regulator
MRVLLVEDPQSVAESFYTRLAGGDIAVVLARGAADSLSRTPEARPDVILLALPTQAACRLLRCLAGYGARAPVLVVTPSPGPEERARILDAGADACLSMPVDLEELQAGLRALARRASPGAPGTLRIGDLEVDLARRIARRGARRISLTYQESRILELLARHRGRVVSRACIMEHLYCDSARRSSNVVNVYIGFLRRKIDAGFDAPLIQTRWGEGYLLMAERA